jgi:hypothetical protein
MIIYVYRISLVGLWGEKHPQGAGGAHIGDRCLCVPYKHQPMRGTQSVRPLGGRCGEVVDRLVGAGGHAD